MSSRGRIARAAGVMSIATLIRRILGYIRDMIVTPGHGPATTIGHEKTWNMFSEEFLQ